MVGFMASLPGFGDVVGGDRTDNERIGRVQYLEYHDDQSSGIRSAEGNGTAGGAAHVERGVFVVKCGLDFFRGQAMLGDVGRIAARLSRLISIDEGVAQIHRLFPYHRCVVF
jgi:hypothetical protein